MSNCLPCIRGLHGACRGPCDCSHALVGYGNADTNEASSDEGYQGEVVEGVTTTRSRRLKLDDSLKDQQSTGRKRAARMYPLDRSGDCEWLGKSNCGGGPHPILGCGLNGIPAGKQRARHHGPDKNTLNNDESNVHRICHSCHNRWHAANDPDYIPGQPIRGD